MPHGAVRAYVMGERGARNEPATPDDIEAMGRIVAEGIAAGALGFSTSRTLAHRAIDGEPVPGTFAAEDELFGIAPRHGRRRVRAGARRRAGRGPRRTGQGGRLDAPAGRGDGPTGHVRAHPEQQRPDGVAGAAELSLHAPGVRPQVHGRTVSVLLGMSTRHPFLFTKTWRSSGLAQQPWREQVARLRSDVTLRDALLADATVAFDRPGREGVHVARARVRARATRRTTSPAPSAASPRSPRQAERGIPETMLDLMLADGRSDAAEQPDPQLQRRIPRRRGRDAPASDVGVRARRRRRPRQRDLRRVDAPPSCCRTGPATGRRDGCRSSWRCTS